MTPMPPFPFMVKAVSGMKQPVDASNRDPDPDLEPTTMAWARSVDYTM